MVAYSIIKSLITAKVLLLPVLHKALREYSLYKLKDWKDTPNRYIAFLGHS